MTDELAEVGADHEADHSVGVELRAQQPCVHVFTHAAHEHVDVGPQRGAEQTGELRVAVRDKRSQTTRPQHVVHLTPCLFEREADLVPHAPLAGHLRCGDGVHQHGREQLAAVGVAAVDRRLCDP